MRFFFVLARCNVSFALEKSTEWESGLVAGGEEKRRLKQLKEADSSSAAQSSASWTRGIAAVGEARRGGGVGGVLNRAFERRARGANVKGRFGAVERTAPRLELRAAAEGRRRKKRLFFSKIKNKRSRSGALTSNM